MDEHREQQRRDELEHELALMDDAQRRLYIRNVTLRERRREREEREHQRRMERLSRVLEEQTPGYDQEQVIAKKVRRYRELLGLDQE